METVLDYRVPIKFFTPLADFDGSVIVERTVGEVPARCHDEQANSLALHLMHDIVTGEKNVEEAREYYGKEFLDARRKQPTLYMDKLHFEPGTGTADADERVLSTEQLEEAVEEGKQGGARPRPARLEADQVDRGERGRSDERGARRSRCEGRELEQECEIVKRAMTFFVREIEAVSLDRLVDEESRDGPSPACVGRSASRAPASTTGKSSRSRTGHSPTGS